MSPILFAALAAGALVRADPPACLAETSPQARAACIALAADTLLSAMAAEAAAAAARLSSTEPDRAAAFLASEDARRDAAREGMEAACPREALARARCRLATAEAEAAALAARIAGTPAAAPYAGYDPRLEVTPLPGGRYRVAPVIDLPAP